MSTKCIFLFFAFAFLSISNLRGENSPLPTLSIGGGYLDGGANHLGGLLQIEYKCGKYLWHTWRPQLTFLVPEFSSLFLGLGLGWEWKITDKITLTPSITPGFYYKGKSRNLGFPVEFRSALELSYQLGKGWIGFQATHLSNAHLGNRNPGMNAYVLFIAFPIL